MLTGTAQIGTMRKLSALLTSLSLVASRAFLQTSSINTKSSSSQSQQRRGPTLSSAAADRITLDKMVESLRERVYEKILVVAGAGISCSAGIPDVSSVASAIFCARRRPNYSQYASPITNSVPDSRIRIVSQIIVQGFGKSNCSFLCFYPT